MADIVGEPGRLSPVSIPCTCGEKILMPLEAILTGQGGMCWNCGTRLSINMQANRSAIEALRRVTSKIDAVRVPHVRP